MAALAATVANAPAVALADSGPSAGDNQYLDPLASTTPAAKPKTVTTPTSTGTATTTPAPTTTPPASTQTQTSSATATGATASPTATTSGAASRTLPYTGYEAWLVIGVGAGIAGAGVAIRRRGLGSR